MIPLCKGVSVLSYRTILLILFSIIGIHQICFATNAHSKLTVVFEHGDLHERIQQVTKEISARPDSAFLYFKRGKLYFEHEDFEAAISDLDTASTMNYQGVICDLIYAKSYQQLEQLDSAMGHVDQILHTDSFNVNALKIKGNILWSQQQYTEAANQFELVIEHARRRLPENYLVAAKAWAADTSESSPIKAIAILQKGMEDLGPIYIFYDEMITIFMKHSLFEEALATQDKIIQQAKRKEKGYYKAALISLQMRNPIAAREYLNHSTAAINALPPRLKTTPAIKQLRKNISKLLQGLRDQ